MGHIKEFIFQHTKECCRIIATTFLSLLLPISFLFIARQVTGNNNNNNKSYYYYNNSPQIFLTLFMFIFSIAALVHGLTNGRAAIFTLINQLRFAAWVLLFLIEVPCLYLWINVGKPNDCCNHGSKFQSSSFVFVESNIETLRYFSRRSLEILIHDYSTVRSASFLPWEVVLFVGLHETTVLWYRSVVARVVNEGVSGLNDREDLKWIEQVILGVAYCCLWWRRVREDAEAMVVRDHVVGWWLYYLTAAIGVVKVVRSLVWFTTWVYRYMHLAYKSGTLYVSLLD